MKNSNTGKFNINNGSSKKMESEISSKKITDFNTPFSMSNNSNKTKFFNNTNNTPPQSKQKSESQPKITHFKFANSFLSTSNFY
jgi:hypothetical protein